MSQESAETLFNDLMGAINTFAERDDETLATFEECSAYICNENGEAIY